MKTFTLLLASAVCCLSAVPAFAKNGNAPLTVTGTLAEDPDTIRVSYSDLNLTNATDVGVLRTRVRRAARRTCDAIYHGAMLSQTWGCLAVVHDVAGRQIAAAIKRAGTGENLAERTVQWRLARK